MKHILFISNLPSKGWGGSEELWSSTALRLCEKGLRISVDVISALTNRRLLDLQSVGAEVHQRKSFSARYRQLAEIIYRDKGSEPLSWLKQAVSDSLLNASWYRRLDKLRPDFVVISQTDNFNGWDWMRACEIRSLPFVTIAQAASEFAWPTLSLAEAIAPFYNAAKRQFFVSQRNLALTRLQILSPLVNAEVIRNPFSVSYSLNSIAPMRDVSSVKLACVGRFHIPSKGQDLICQVFAMEKWRLRPIEVKFYGTGEHGPAIQQMIDMLGLENVKIAGYCSNVQSIWDESHGLLLPSRWEGLPLVVVEAMLCGRVPIVTDVAGNIEIIEDGKSGFIATGTTVAAVDAALERAWERRYEWGTIGAKAAESIRALVPEDPADNLACSILRIMDEIDICPIDSELLVQ